MSKMHFKCEVHVSHVKGYFFVEMDWGPFINMGHIQSMNA